MRKPPFFWNLLGLFAALVLSLSLFSGTRAGEGREITIEITGFEFVMSENVTLKPGDTVVFINLDLAPHTATALDKSWDSGSLSKGESWRLEITPETALDYFCRFHPAMRASLSAN